MALNRIEEFMLDQSIREKIQGVTKPIAQTFTATSGQTVFNLSNSYEVGKNLVSVEIDGVPQNLGEGFTETSSTSITLSENVPTGSKVKVIVYSNYASVDSRISDFGSQLADNANRANKETINVLYPPVPMVSAVNDGVTLTKTALNAILNTHRGKRIFFPDGTYLIDNSLIVFDNTVIELSKNAIIKFAPNQTKTSANGWSGNHIIKNDLTNGLKNIEIFGGMIDGNGTTQPQDMHRGIRMESVDGLKIHDIKIKEVAGWGIAHIGCKNFHFYNIEFDQCSEISYGYNGDGITGTSTDGVIENISGYTSDDMVALNAGNQLFTTKNNINNVVIRNIFPKQKSGGTELTHRAVGLYATGGYSLNNIIVDTVIGSTKNSLKLQNFNPELGTGTANNIAFKNITLSVGYLNVATSDEALLIDSITCSTVSLDNIRFKDIQGTTGYVKYGINIQNSPIDTLKINGLTQNITEGTNQCINDYGSIKNLHLSNIEVNFQGAGQGHLYYKGSVDSVVTIIKGQNIRGNSVFHVQRNTTNANVRVDSFDLKMTESRLQLANQSDNDRIYTVEKGLGIVKAGTVKYIGQPNGRQSGIVSGNANYTISLPIAQPDTTYSVIITPDWNAGAVWFDSKTTTSFRANWATAPTANATIGWQLVR